MIREFPIEVVITYIKDYFLSTEFTELGVGPVVVRPVFAEYHNIGLFCGKSANAGFDEMLD